MKMNGCKTKCEDCPDEVAEQPAQQNVQYTGNGTAGREADIKPTGFFFQMPPQQDIPDLIAGVLGVSRGTAYDMMREALAAPSSTAGYAKKIESLIAERDALKSRLAEQPAPVYLGIRGGFAHDAQIKEKK
jgi:hypothetical protein